MRLSENTETSVNFVSIVSITNVPSTANSPTTSGRPAATRLPKTIDERDERERRGEQVGLAARSFSAWSASWRVTSARPVTAVVTTASVGR